VILSPATAATASLVRHFCQDVSLEGDPFTKVFRSWWVLAKGRSAAGVMRSVSASRSRRIVSRLMSTGLALMGKNPPDWPFDCGQTLSHMSSGTGISSSWPVCSERVGRVITPVCLPTICLCTMSERMPGRLPRQLCLTCMTLAVSIFRGRHVSVGVGMWRLFPSARIWLSRPRRMRRMSQ